MTVAVRSSVLTPDTSNSLTDAVTVPGAVAGDFAIGFAAIASNAATWTCSGVFASTPDILCSRTSLSLAVWLHTLTSGDLGAVATFTETTASHRPAAGIIVLSGASGLDVSATSNGTSASVDALGVTTTQAHDALLTIGVIQSAVSRTNWTHWGTSELTGGNGSVGAGGVELCVDGNMDLGGSAGATSSPLSMVTTPSSGWCAITLAIRVASAPTSRAFSATLSTQAGMSESISDVPSGNPWNLWYATPGAAWSMLDPFNARPDGTWS